jgi:hypothetical protein
MEINGLSTAAPGTPDYLPAEPPLAPHLKVVGVTGVEPVTLRLSSACSNQLSYTPQQFLIFEFRFSI